MSSQESPRGQGRTVGSKYQNLMAQDSIQEEFDDEAAEQDLRPSQQPSNDAVVRVTQPFLPEAVGTVSVSVLHHSQGSAQLGCELTNKAGFYRAQTHEKTTDLTLVDHKVYEKKNVNQLVEDELAEFRKEIEAKFADAQTKNYVMARKDIESVVEETKNDQKLQISELEIQRLAQVESRITLDNESSESSEKSSVPSPKSS